MSSTIEHLVKNLRNVKANLPKLFANRDVTRIDHTEIHLLIVEFDAPLSGDQKGELIHMIVHETGKTPNVEWGDNRIYFQF